MITIDQEIEASAESLAKASETPLDALQASIKAMGKDDLKKAVATLSGTQKALFVEVLGTMQKGSETTEPVSDTTPNGEQHANQARIDQAFQDEEIEKEAEKKKQQIHRNQGDNSPEGFDGQIIKGTTSIDTSASRGNRAAGSMRSAFGGQSGTSSGSSGSASTKDTGFVQGVRNFFGRGSNTADPVSGGTAPRSKMGKGYGGESTDTEGNPATETMETPKKKKGKKDTQPVSDGKSPKLAKKCDMVKGGEGSKGGKVIGHTKSGKPIYDSHSHATHSNFTKQDHNDAARLNTKMSDEADTKAGIIGSPEGDKHFIDAEGHNAQVKAKAKKPAMGHFSDMSSSEHFDAAQEHGDSPMGEFHNHMRVAKDTEAKLNSPQNSVYSGESKKMMRQEIKDRKNKAKDSLKQHNTKGVDMKKAIEFGAMIMRMQEREFPRDLSVEKLAKSFNQTPENVGKVWDALEKADSYSYDDGTKGAATPETDQVKQPKDKTITTPPADVSVPAPKTNIKAKDKDPVDKHAKETADEGQNPPATMKKSAADIVDSAVQNSLKETEIVCENPELAEKVEKAFAEKFSKEDPIIDFMCKAMFCNSIKSEKPVKGEDTKVSVRETMKWLAKDLENLKSMSYIIETEVPEAKEIFEKEFTRIKSELKIKVKEHNSLKKSFKLELNAHDPFTHRKIGQNAHYNVDEFLAKEFVGNLQKGKFDWEDTEGFEALNKSEKDEKPKNPKVSVHDLLAKSADMSSDQLNQAVAMQAKETSGTYMVKSFSDEDMDYLGKSEMLWTKKEK